MKRINIKIAKLGILSGVEEILPNGNKLNAFRGIPYAESPIGKLRFKPPVPLKKFEEAIVDCSLERDVCIQKDMISGENIGSENCLFLNIYTPELNQSQQKIPVMIFLHGGAFISGSGNSDLYSPEYLIQENVITVTCNYRLGPLGFLYLPKAGIYGNAGLFDQLLVLKWVNQNILFFNGDPKNVTLFGESAGASSVHLHILSPISRQFFHKAICQSGTATMDWVMQVEPEEKARILAKSLGCLSTKDEDILSTLQEADAVQLVKNQLLTLHAEEKLRGLPAPFKPVVDFLSPNSIIKKSPIDAIRDGGPINIPIIFGYNSHEGLIMIKDALKKLEVYNKNFQRLIPRSVNLTQDSASSKKVGKEIKEFYFNNKEPSREDIDIITNLMGDFHFTIGMQLSVELHSIFQSKAPLYFYRFSFDGELNLFKKLLQLDKIPGACHADELFYLFNLKMVDFKINEESPAYKIRKTMCKMWTNFAKYGNPTPNEDRYLPVKWESIKNSSDNKDKIYENCLVIDITLELIENPDKERISFWKSIYKKWNESFFKAKL